MSFERSLSWILQLENYPLWKNEGALKHLWKLTGKHFTRVYFLMKLYTSLFLEYFQMFPFETTSIKACKLYIVCIICSSQQIRWLRGWKWSMGKSKCSHKEKRQCVHSWKETAFFLFDHSFKGMESGLIWAIQ